MHGSPIDIAIIAALALITFGPKKPQGPWGWKVETNEKPKDRKPDPFAQANPDSFFHNDEN
jgi:hypothetical protein